MSVAVVFPGQGEQRPGMLHRLPDGSDDLVRTASAVLGQDALGLDTPQALAGTRATQLALLLSGVAWARALVPHLRPAYLAGHSVGMWAAAVAGGSLAFDAAVELVDLRGRLMERTAGVRRFAMIAVDGLPADTVASAARQARDDGRDVWAGNVNAPLRCTVSAAVDDLELIEQRLRALGARRTTRLAVAVPAHTPVMAPVERGIRDALAGVAMSAPRIPIAGNVTGRTLLTAEQLRTDLAESISRPTRWDVGTAILAERGADTWIQVPPGRSLLGLLPEHRLALALEDLGLTEASARVRAAR